MNLRFLPAAAFALLLPACGEGAEPLDPAAVEAGRVAFQSCTACHSAGLGEGHKVGPNLYGVAGAPAARQAGYDYSEALRASGLVWTDEALAAYLEDPLGTVPGGKMVYAGVPDAASRDAVITYLKSKR